MKAKHAVLSVFAMCVAGAVHAGGGAYPEPYLWTSESGKSRAEVTAELREAQRLGLITNGEEDVKGVVSEATGKSRAEVVAEFEEAQRLGLVTSGEEGVKAATPEQEQMIVEAGRRAAEQITFAKGAGK
jgi:predicted RNase H-like HicB family nuclease